MSGWLAGVDLGGTSIKAALGNERGEIAVEDAIPTDAHDGPEAVIARIAELVERLKARVDTNPAEPLAGLGLGVPGLVEIATGTTKFLPNLPSQWRDVPVATKLGERLRCPVRLLNDVRTATLAELRFGHGQGRPAITMAFFSLGTGVGGGVVIDGCLRLGPLGAAGELGHQTILPTGPRCGCGNRGCLETLASGPAIAAEGVRLMRAGLAPALHEFVGGDANQVTPRAMAAVAEQDGTVHDALVEAAAYLGIAAANVVTTLHPDLIVLGGGVAEIGELLIATVGRVIRERVRMFPAADVDVVPSRLGPRAGLLGALALAAMTSEPLQKSR